MSIVNISLDTVSKQMALTINGVLVPFFECDMSKMVWDGDEHISFSYTTEGADSNGLMEKRRFFLPGPEDIVAEADIAVNDDGLASKAVFDDEKAKADVVDFLKQERNR